MNAFIDLAKHSNEWIPLLTGKQKIPSSHLRQHSPNVYVMRLGSTVVTTAPAMNQWPIFTTQELLLQDRKRYYKLQALTIKQATHSKGKSGDCAGTWKSKLRTTRSGKSTGPDLLIWERTQCWYAHRCQGTGHLVEFRSYLHGTIKTKYVNDWGCTWHGGHGIT